MRALVAIAVSLTVLLVTWGARAGGPSPAVPLAKAGPVRHAVTIVNLKFTPDEIEIAPGDTVVWTNQDARDHNVTASDGSFDSGKMGSGRTFEHRFDKPGTFSYVDDLYPRMKGKIVVKAK